MIMELKYKKVLVKGLLYGCPMGIVLNECVITDIRRLPLKERANHIEVMKERKIDFLLMSHRKCRTNRDEKRNELKLQRLTQTVYQRLYLMPPMLKIT